MNYNLLLWEGLPVSLAKPDRQALGIPPRTRIDPGRGAMRLESLPLRSVRDLRDIATRIPGLRLTTVRGGREVFLTLPPDHWEEFQRHLYRGNPSLQALGRGIAETRTSLGRPPRRIRLARRFLAMGRRTRIQGILNLTPDSFYDGGRYPDPERACDRALEMEAEGADLIDIGGESSRPGSEPVGAREEKRRILPVIEKLAGSLRVPISVDTTKAEVADAALSAGAEIVNDISALTQDPRLARVTARHRAGLILSHIQGRPRTMQKNPRYRHLLPEVVAFLRKAQNRAVEAGVAPDGILIDPGIGFGKTPLHNLLLLRHLSLLRGAGRPILVGASRKSFLGKITGLGPEMRLEGSLAAGALAIYEGASVLRVHDVAATVRMARLVEAVRDGTMG